MKKIRISKNIKRFLIVLMLFIMIMPSTTVFAEDALFMETKDDYLISKSTANSFFKKIDEYNKVSNSTGGVGYVFGLSTTSSLTGSTTAYYQSAATGSDYKYIVFSEENFIQLSPTKQSKLVTQFISTVVYDNLNTKSISSLIDILTKSGADSTIIMNLTLGKTKPFWAKAFEILAPFNSPLGIALAVAIILLGSCVTFVVVTDLFYIGIPFFRGLGVNTDGKRAMWVSKSAFNAVQKGEENNGTSFKIILDYMKDISLVLLLLGICIVYLASGKIFGFIGYVMDGADGFF